MYKRDLITAEIQKLSQALARILGLKEQGKLEEADHGLDEILENDFGILYTDLLASDTDDFNLFLTEKNFPAEKLDMFSQFLYLKFNMAETSASSLSVALKLQLIYDLLEMRHHVINMINLGRQKTVKQYINSNS